MFCYREPLEPLLKLQIQTEWETTSNECVCMYVCMYVFHITDICTWENMPATSHIYVPLHYHCSLHTDPILLHTVVKKDCIFHLSCYCNICANNKYVPQMSNICHKCQLHHVHTRQICGPLVHIYFPSLAYVPEQICLPNYTHMFHCTFYGAYLQTPSTLLYI